MEYRFLGTSGFKVSVLGLGTATFGGAGPFFGAIGNTGIEEARRLVAICIDAGINLFDTADAYSDGASESILGAAIKGRRDEVVLSTKISLRTGTGPNDVGASRHHLVKSTDRALQRLGTDYIDVLHLHQFDAMTSVEAVMSTLDDLVRAGKIRFIGASNFSGWQLMKCLATADRFGYQRFTANQAYYSLIGRQFEWELMPLGMDQGVGTIVSSPLGWGRLTGRIRRDAVWPRDTRLHATSQFAPPVDAALLYRVIDVLDVVAIETGRTVAQVALNWVLQRPTISSVLIGARDERQLRENIAAAGWQLSAEHIAKLNEATAMTPPYPYYQYWTEPFAERNPRPDHAKPY